MILKAGPSGCPSPGLFPFGPPRLAAFEITPRTTLLGGARRLSISQPYPARFPARAERSASTETDCQPHRRDRRLKHVEPSASLGDLQAGEALISLRKQ